MKLETVSIAELKPLEKNVRYHTETQVKEFSRSLKQFGQTRPFVIDEDNYILIGNCMFLAMQQVGMDTALAYRMKGLSQAKKKKLILSDNRIYSLGGDNADVMEDYIREIASLGDLNIAGFDEDILKNLIRDNSEVEQSVMSYGTLSQEVVEKAQNAHENVVSASPAQSVQGSQTASVHIEQSQDVQQVQSAEIVKTIICPNCGEIIRI